MFMSGLAQTKIDENNSAITTTKISVPQNLVREHGVDAIADRAADDRSGRCDDAVERCGRPNRSGPSLRRPAPACRPRRALRGLLAVSAQPAVRVAVEELAFEVAVAVEQQSLDEKIAAPGSVRPALSRLGELAGVSLKLGGHRVLGDARRVRLTASTSASCSSSMPHAAIGLHRDHRHAEPLRQRRDIDFDLPVAGQVDHVERDDGRQAERRAPGSPGTDCARGCWRRRCERTTSGGPSLSRRPSRTSTVDHLVGRSRREAVGAGQIDQLEVLLAVLAAWPVFFSTVTPG